MRGNVSTRGALRNVRPRNDSTGILKSTNYLEFWQRNGGHWLVQRGHNGGAIVSNATDMIIPLYYHASPKYSVQVAVFLTPSSNSPSISAYFTISSKSERHWYSLKTHSHSDRLHSATSIQGIIIRTVRDVKWVTMSRTWVTYWALLITVANSVRAQRGFNIIYASVPLRCAVVDQYTVFRQKVTRTKSTLSAS